MRNLEEDYYERQQRGESAGIAGIAFAIILLIGLGYFILASIKALQGMPLDLLPF